MSRTVSGDPLEPCTVEKRTKTGVVFQGVLRNPHLYIHLNLHTLGIHHVPQIHEHVPHVQEYVHGRSASFFTEVEVF